MKKYKTVIFFDNQVEPKAKRISHFGSSVWNEFTPLANKYNAVNRLNSNIKQYFNPKPKKTQLVKDSPTFCLLIFFVI